MDAGGMDIGKMILISEGLSAEGAVRDTRSSVSQDGNVEACR